MGKTAREVMTGGAECIGENDTITDAAKRLAELTGKCRSGSVRLGFRRPAAAPRG